MFKAVVLAWGLLTGTAWASDSEGLVADPPPTAAMFQDPVAGAMSAEEEKRAARLAALEASQSTKAGRVVVLQWQGQDTDYTNDTLVRNVKARIARPDAKFYPEVDLYQVGRREPDKTIRATEQRATVPASAIGEVMAEV